MEVQRCRTRLRRLDRNVTPPPDVDGDVRVWGSHDMRGLLLSAITPVQPIEDRRVS